MAKTIGVPYVHLELMSEQAEQRLGNAPYILILTRDYQTDTTRATIEANLTHAAQVLNKTTARDTVAFPYVATDADTGFGGKNRADSWLYVNMKNIREEVEAIKAWLLLVATTYHSNGLKVDTSKNPATIWKGAWSSTELVKPNT